MSNNRFFKRLTIALTCLFGLGGAVGLATSLTVDKTVQETKAAETVLATFSLSGLEKDSEGQGSVVVNGITFSYGGYYDTNTTDHNKSSIAWGYFGSKIQLTRNGRYFELRITQADIVNNGITGFSFELERKGTDSVTYTVSQGSSVFVNSTYSSDATITKTKTSLGTTGDFVFKMKNNEGAGTIDNLQSFTNNNELKLYGYGPQTVSITKGTGIKSVYLSATNTATSGSASGTSFGYASTVYGFGELAKGYKAKSTWTKVSGTAATEGAKYRVGSLTVSSGTNSFGTIAADPITYKVKYNGNKPNDAPAGKSVSNIPADATWTYDSNATLGGTPSLDGYVFGGWYKEAACTNKVGNASQALTKPNLSYTQGATVNLYAKWTHQQCTITLNKNGGTGGLNSVNVASYSTLPTLTSSNLPTRTGYTFNGYYNTNSATPTDEYKFYNADGTPYKNWTFGNSIFYANWTANNYTITFNKGDGTGGDDSVEVTYDSLPTAINIPSKDDCTFQGYYSAAGGTGTRYYDNNGQGITKWNIASDTTLYAYFTEDMVVTSSGYTGTWDGSNHTGSVTVTSPTSGYTITYTTKAEPIDSDYTLTEIPTFSDAGTYVVRYKVAKDGYTNFYGSFTVTINKADSNYTTNPAGKTPFDYNGSAQELLETAGVADYGSLEYKIMCGETLISDWSTTLPSTTNVGDYKIFYRTTGDDNHNPIAESDTNYVEVTILEVDKTDLNNLVATVEAYYDTIKENYATIAGTLNTNKDNIVTNYVNNKNVTATQVANAVAALNGYLDTAKVDVTETKINAIGTVAYTAESKALIDDARNYYNDVLNTAQQALVSNYTTLTDAETLYNNVHAVVTEINNLGTVTNDAAFRAKVTSARSNYNALTDGEKNIFPADVLKILTDDEAVVDILDKINAIGVVTYSDDSKAKIDAVDAAIKYAADNYPEQIALIPSTDYAVFNQAYEDYYNVDDVVSEINTIGPLYYNDEIDNFIKDARKDYDFLSDYQKSIFPADVLKILTDDEAAFAVMGKINDIGELKNTDACRALVKTAKDAYDALTDDQKAVINQQSVLILNNDIAAMDVVGKINDIGELTSEDDKSQGLIDTARNAYNALSNDQKSIFPVEALQLLEDKEAALPVVYKIDAIGDVTYTNESKNLIDEAQSAYDALTDSQKAVVANYDVLEQANEDYDNVNEVVLDIKGIGTVYYVDESKALIDDARTNYDALSDYQKSIFPADVLKILTDDEAGYEAMDKINAIGEVKDTDECIALIDNARSNYNELSDDQKGIVRKEFVKTLEDAEKAYEAMHLIDELTEVAYTDEFKADLDSARSHYDALSADQKALVKEDVVKHLEDLETSYDALVKIEEIGDVTLGGENDSLEDIQTARKAYEALSDEQQNLINDEDYQLLLDAERVYAIMELIADIGKVEYTEASKEKIDTAKTIYDASSEVQKSEVDNVAVLNKAYTDYYAVDASATLIKNIGDITFGKESKDKIEAARKSYDALTADQKAFFPVETLKSLTDKEKAYAALELIANIGEVGYDTVSETRKNDAREFYDSLTPEQKQLININDYQVLEKAEESYASQKQTGDVVLIIMLIVASLVLLGGGFALYLLFRKKKNSDDGNNNGGNNKKSPAKAMSFAGIPAIILTSHYLDAGYIALYVIAGLAVSIWVVALVFFVLKKKKKASQKQEVSQEIAVEVKPVEEVKPAVQEPARETQILNVVTNAEGDEIVTKQDRNGNIFEIRFVKSFTAKLIQASDESKKYYEELKNYVLSYKKVSIRKSWNYESIHSGRNSVLKFAVRGKTLCLYLPLNADEYAGSTYIVEKVESKKYEDVPCLYRIKNDRRCQCAKELIDVVASKLGLIKGEEEHESYYLHYEENKSLIARGLIKELQVPVNKPVGEHASISVSEADEKMSDEEAEASIIEDVNSKKHEGKKGIINIDTIGEAFQDGDTVDIESLKEKKLIPSNVGYVKVLARGSLNKKLNVSLQDYSLQAVKMIVLEGGTVSKVK